VVTALDPAQPLAPDFRDSVQQALAEFLDNRRATLAGMGPELDPLIDLAATFTGGGKRLRPAFTVWGYVAAAGLPAVHVRPSLVAAAASLELLHVSALVHDDVMDNSDTRRGLPAAHLQFARLHDDAGWTGPAEQFGRAGAILLGDLLVMWSDEMLHTAGLPDEILRPALPYVAAMRTEVTCGQYLDVVAQAGPLHPHRPAQDIDQIRRVVEYKAARYSVRRPVQFGAALGGGDETLQEALAAYGSPLGRAFQYRDDVLGMFGDEARTGKPAAGDLREGKHTLLLAYALADSPTAERRRLMGLVGVEDLDDDAVAEARAIITASGAVERVETAIETDLAQALAALESADLTDEGRTALTALAYAATRRVV